MPVCAGTVFIPLRVELVGVCRYLLEARDGNKLARDAEVCELLRLVARKITVEHDL